MKPELKVVETIYDTNIRDIPATLRKLADGIEAGEYGEVDMAVTVIHHFEEGLEKQACFGLGDDAGDRLKAAGLMFAGLNSLTCGVE